MRVGVSYAKGVRAVRLRVDGQPPRDFSRSNLSGLHIVGGSGNDTVRISRAVDVAVHVQAGAGNDRVRGGVADDTLEGGPGDDVLRGGGGRDTLLGGEGDDRLDGGSGADDQIDPGPGRDRTPGVGRGDDRVFVAAAAAATPGDADVPGDGVPPVGSDATEWIQRAIDAAVGAGGSATVRLPIGWFQITRTLHVPTGTGLKMVGAGQIPDVRISGHYGPTTTLMWYGPAGGTMFECTGAGTLTLTDLTMIGRPSYSAPNQAGTLVWGHATPESGVAGAWSVRNVNFIDAACGLRLNDELAGAAADRHFERVAFVSCETGFDAAGASDTHYVFDYLAAEASDRVVHLARGGQLTVNLGSFTNCHGTGDDDYAIDIGPGVGAAGAGFCAVNQLRFEGGVRVRVTGPGRRVEFRGLHEAAPINGGATFDVTASTVVLTGATLLRTFSPGWVRLRPDETGSPAAFSVDGAMLENQETPGALIDAAPRSDWSIRNCFRGWGTPIPDDRSQKL